MQVRSVASVRIERAHWLPPISKWPPKEDAEFFLSVSLISLLQNHNNEKNWNLRYTDGNNEGGRLTIDRISAGRISGKMLHF